MKAIRLTLAVVTAALGMASVLGVGQASAATPLNAATLTKYVDPLPIPPVAASAAPGYYELHMLQGTSKMHRDLPPTTVWGYGGGYLGPTIEARTGQPIQVRWLNDLPFAHLFAASLDRTLEGSAQGPDVRAVTHLHGGNVPDTSDGGPDAWFLPGQSALYDYPNDQPATMLWYHDHAMGVTRLNPYAGLAGLYFIRDAYEDSLNLPGGPADPAGPLGPYEVPLVLQDKQFDTNGQLMYATAGNVPDVHPTWVPEFFGDAIVVNGKAWPYLNVEPRKYRFRIVNGSNARFYGLTLVTAKDSNKSKPVLSQIGAEGGLMPITAALQQVLVAPGERADLIVDFSAYAGQTLTLRNNAKAPYPSGAAPDPQTVGQVMQFRVAETLSRPDLTQVPASPRPITRLDPAAAANVRDIKLREILEAGEPVELQLEDHEFNDPATLTPKVGTTEVWRLINTTADTHPIHLHLVQFQVLDRQNFDVASYLNTDQLKLNGVARAPNANELGWKDTVQVNPGEVVRIIATFNRVGTYPIHCHILEHEENEMMRPFQVLP